MSEDEPLPQEGAVGSLADAGGESLGFLNADSRTGTAANGKLSLTIDQAAFRLVGGGPGWGGIINHAFNVTYAYRADAPLKMPDDAGGFSRFNQAQIDQTELALKAWSDVANIVFTRAGSGNTGDAAYSNSASILLGNYTTGVAGSVGFAMLPGNTNFNSTAGDVWINSSYAYNAAPTVSNYGGQVVLHELGHAIGLDHPSTYNSTAGASFTYATDASYYEDDRQYTVMSYFNESNTGGDFRGLYATTPLLDDIAAAQLEYGANMATRTGDTVYGFNSNADQPWFLLTSSVARPIFVVWDAGGKDTLDFFGFTVSQTIDLRAGYFSSVGGLIGNVAIAQGANIENAIGGSGADLIYGNALGNTINGGAGNDTIQGLAGDDYLRGDDGNDVIYGGEGLDDINGNKGNDLEYGGNGNDWVVGGQGNDQLFGENGNDIVYGNLGNDTLSGGDGDDWVRGGQGDDILDGGSGDDLIWGDRGNDTIRGGSGADQFHTFVGAEIDRILDFNGFEGDRIVIDDATTFAISMASSDMLITLTTRDVVVLVGVTPNAMQLSWIILA
jgi:serralysin